ncbi:hypothetical protein Trydic_g5961 [Trypoxylus dichotomus]
MICGGKGVGKSTVLRYITNSLLRKYSQVLVIDLDPGQSEFTVPGCVSAVIIKEPIFGPSFTHLQVPEKCVFVENVDVTLDPNLYIKCVKELLKQSENFKGMPTLINYMGYTHSYGINIASTIVTYVLPTILLQINSVQQSKNFEKNLTTDVVIEYSDMFGSSETTTLTYQFIIINSMSDGLSSWQAQGRTTREMCILSYFSQVVDESLSLTSKKVSLYKISLSDITLVCNNLKTIDAKLAAFNASLVVLCTLTDTDNIYNCHGWGIVRGINEEILVLITPVDESTLETITHLAIGSITLPASVLMYEDANVGLVPYVLLESCINWFREEHGSASYTKKELHTKIYEQWLLLDLRDVEIAQLPPNIKDEKKIVLNKNLSLQMMHVVDISKSKLSQLQKIKNLNSLTRGFDEEKEAGSVGKRMLQLTLTDGVQEIQAIEYKTVPVLNINLTPGTKIKINSPIVIRRGQILLEQHNVKLLGGEVEEILISHAAENVLARCLHLPENPKPVTINESFSESNINASGMNVNTTARNNAPRNQSMAQTTINQFINRPNRNQATENRNNTNISVEEELRIAAEMRMLFEAEEDLFREDDMLQRTESNVTSAVRQQPTKAATANNYFDEQSEMDSEIDALLEIEEEISNQEKNTRNSFHESKIKTLPQSNNIVNNMENHKNDLNDSLEMGNELFNSLELDNHLDKIEEIHHTSEKIPIKQILENIKKHKFGKYRLHAKFKSVIEKMTLRDEKWIVKISITDGDEDLVVFIDNSILTEMTGFTPQEAMNLKLQVQSKNQDAVQMIMKALDQLKTKLLELDCEMEIEYNGSAESPMITKLL